MNRACQNLPCLRDHIIASSYCVTLASNMTPVHQLTNFQEISDLKSYSPHHIPIIFCVASRPVQHHSYINILVYVILAVPGHALLWLFPLCAYDDLRLPFCEALCSIALQTNARQCTLTQLPCIPDI
jgi:hypothetical protein